MTEMTEKTGEGFSTLVLSLKFGGGTVGSLVGSHETSYAYPDSHRPEVSGTKGRIVLDDTVCRFSFQRAKSPLSCGP